jgi:vancomycin permeability regulator SanA
MTKLYLFKIPKSDLQTLPERKLALLLGCGKILNVLNAATKLYFFAINTIKAAKSDPKEQRQ